MAAALIDQEPEIDTKTVPGFRPTRRALFGFKRSIPTSVDNSWARVGRLPGGVLTGGGAGRACRGRRMARTRPGIVRGCGGSGLESPWRRQRPNQLRPRVARVAVDVGLPSTSVSGVGLR